MRGDRGRWRVSVRIILHISGFLLRGHDASGRYSWTAVATLSGSITQAIESFGQKNAVLVIFISAN